MSPEDKKNALAAGIILVGFTAAFFFLPKLVLALGRDFAVSGIWRGRAFDRRVFWGVSG